MVTGIVIEIGRGIVQVIEGVLGSREKNYNRCVGRERVRVIVIS
jgi:hypothetical protein